MRVSGSVLISIGAIAALVALGVTDQVLPAVDPRTAELRPWIAARALGITAYLLLALEVGLGLVLSHPRNTGEWRKTKQTFPWHEMVSVFTFAFVTLHVVLLAIDPYAKVGIIGALVPGFSEFRPGGGRARLHRAVRDAVHRHHREVDAPPAVRAGGCGSTGSPPWPSSSTWIHAVLAGTDGGALLPLYLATGLRDPRRRRAPLVDRACPPAARHVRPRGRGPSHRHRRSAGRRRHPPPWRSPDVRGASKSDRPANGRAGADAGRHRGRRGHRRRGRPMACRVRTDRHRAGGDEPDRRGASRPRSPGRTTSRHRSRTSRSRWRCSAAPSTRPPPA